MSDRSSLGSVLIPAHDEERVITRCLDSLFDGLDPRDVDVVVACNGCSDGTAAAARAAGYGVEVIELDVASKPAALRTGERALTTLPRIYLDADVVLTGAAATALLEHLAARRHARGAAADRVRHVSVLGTGTRLLPCPHRVPGLMTALWGAGVYGLSTAGRQRFDEYPDVVADDLFVNSCFDASEIEILPCDAAVVAAPRRAADLVHVMSRAYRGAAELSARPPGQRVERETWSRALDFSRLCLQDAKSIPDVAVYAGFAAGARLSARLRPSARWEHDHSSRAMMPYER